MISSDYKGHSLRTRLFIGFMVVCFTSIIGSTLITYIIFRKITETQSQKDMYKKTASIMSSLDYAINHEFATEKDLPIFLKNQIYEIADINKHDLILYDLKGQYLISNKDLSLISQKKIPQNLLEKIKNKDERLDIKFYDNSLKSNITSSYILLKNNELKPIAIVYFPSYHNDDLYLDFFDKYIQIIVLVNIVLIALSIWMSWGISNNLTKNIRKISDRITKINLLGKDLRMVKYHQKDELTPLIDSYNRIILTIEEQRQQLSLREKENAWREMAKQVAHEVKNPLTPMKLLIQNFERKFDPTHERIKDKVTRLCTALVDQIDVIARVANAFSEFAELPKKNTQLINLNQEIKSLVRIFNQNHEISFHNNEETITVYFDKTFFSRILTNLITNAQQALSDNEKPVINIDLEKLEKGVIITIEDNGVGIPKDKINQIFEPNFTTKNSGMGLGLSMVKKMLEEYDGEIEVKSIEGRGTKFTIVLPRKIIATS